MFFFILSITSNQRKVSPGNGGMKGLVGGIVTVPVNNVSVVDWAAEFLFISSNANTVVISNLK